MPVEPAPGGGARPLWLAGQPDGAALDAAIAARLDRDLPRLAGHDKIWVHRFRSGLLTLLPSVALATGTPDLAALSRLRVLEVGAGTGSKTLGLAPFFGAWTGIDIDADALDQARSTARQLGLGPLDLRPGEAAEIERYLDVPGRYDVIILYAVVEHLTIAERLHLLARAWAALAPGGVLMVGELPNRLGPVDHHSTFLPFIDALPADLALAYARRAERPDFQTRVLASDTPELALYRFGRGASFHEFMVALGDDFAQSIVLDAWDNLSLNQFPLTLAEGLLLRQFQGLRRSPTAQTHPIAPGFARYWMDFALRKGAAGPPRPPVLAFDPRTPDAARPLDGPLTLAVPSWTRSLSLGWVAPALTGTQIVKGGRGATLFQAEAQQIRDAAGGHWNPVVVTTFAVPPGGSVIIDAPGGTAAVASAVFR